MKLRFVKFLTSRENEIEKKEEAYHRVPCRRPARPQPEPPLPLLLLSSLHHFTLSLHQSASSAAQFPLRHVPGEQYSPAIPSPAVPLSLPSS